MLSIGSAAALGGLIWLAHERLTAEEFAAVRWRLYGALLGNLALPVGAWFLMKRLNRKAVG